MSETSMLLALSKSFKIFSKSGIHVVRDQLGVSSTSWILLSVQEPFWNVVFSWSGNDVIHCGNLFFSHFSTSLIDIDLSDTESKNGKSSTNTFDLSKTERSLLFTVDVCVLHSENVLEIVWIIKYQ